MLYSEQCRFSRNKCIEDARGIHDKAAKESRALSTDESAEFDKHMAEADRWQTSADSAVKLERERKFEAEETRSESAETSKPRPNQTREQRSAELLTLRAAGRDEMSDKDAADLDALELRSFNRYLVGGYSEMTQVERRALGKSTDSEGGYLSPPIQWVNQLIKFVDDQVFIRGLATTYSVANADSLGAPSLDNDPADDTWTTELGTGSADSTMSLGAREMTPNPLAKSIKVSKTLLRRSAISAETLVRERLAYKCGITQEKAFLTGNGAKQPLGIFTQSNDGIPTSRDIEQASGATTAITADGLLAVKYALKSQYQMSGSWIFHRDGVKQLAQIKDGENRYMWSGSIVEGEPDRLLGRPVFMSEYAPNTFTAGLLVGIFGDFQQYWIVDSLGVQIQRVVELYSETNQDGFFIRAETDGQPVLSEAFARLKLAAS